MNKSLAILLLLLTLPLAACQTVLRGESARGPTHAPVDRAFGANLLDGEFDNHEQVWAADKGNSTAILPPHVVVTIETTPNKDWTVWHILLDAPTPIKAVWAMQTIDAAGDANSMLPHRALVASPAMGTSFDTKQWTPLDACALHGTITFADIRVSADPAACAAIVPGIGPQAALLPLAIEREGEWLRVRLYADQARGADTREDARKVKIYGGWAAINGAGPKGGGDSNDWHMNRGLRLGSEGGHAALTWRDGKPSGYALSLERLTYRERNEAVLKLSIIEDATGRTIAYAWANPEATRIGINIGWLQVGLDRNAPTSTPNGKLK